MFSQEFIADLSTAVAKEALCRMAAEGTVPKRLYTIAEAATYIGPSVKAIEHLIARGTIQVTRLDGKRQIDRIALDKLIEERTYFEC